MKYAIIESGSKQYMVSEGDIINIERISTKDKEYNFNKILMAVDGENVKIGKPTLSDVKVVGEILGEVKGDKIRVFKYRKTEQYRKTKGHKQNYTKVKITKIEV
jgi:large subunit ribosomal protein L21